MRKFIEREVTLPQSGQDRLAELFDRAQQGDADSFVAMTNALPDINGIWIEDTGITNKPVKLKITTVSSE